jgi:arginyl-tRNA synthetase
LRLKGVTISREELVSAQLSLFSEEDYADVLRLLIQYPGIVKNTFKRPSYEATVLLAYLFRLVDGIGQVWESVRDGDEGGSSSKDDVAESALFECVRQVLENGMRILGIVPLEP